MKDESYVYWTVHHLDGSITRDQLDITYIIISLCTAEHVSDVNTSILRSLRLICWVLSWVVLLWFDACWCYVVVWLGWCGIRMQAEARFGWGGVVSVCRLKHGLAGVVWYPDAGWSAMSSFLNHCHWSRPFRLLLLSTIPFLSCSLYRDYINRVKRTYLTSRDKFHKFTRVRHLFLSWARSIRPMFGILLLAR